MSVRQHFEEAYSVLETFLQDEQNFKNIEKGGELMVQALEKGLKRYGW